MSENQETQEPDEKSVRFHYVKNPHFTTIHVDGAIGGITPSGDLHVAFYAERLPIPTLTEFEIGPDGKLGEEILDARVSREGILRELLVDAFMDLRTATQLRDWFQRNVEMLEKAYESAI